MADQDQTIDTTQNNIVGVSPSAKQSSSAFKIPPPPLVQGLATDINNPPIVDYLEKLKKTKTAKEAQDIQGDLLQQQLKTQRDVGAYELAQEQYIANAEAEIQRQARQKRDEIMLREKELKLKYPYPEFHPTQDNINDLAILFGGISLLGTAIGGRGRMSSMNSLAAMTGMMQGWREGRADLWKQEKDKFDVEFKRIKEILDDVKKDSDRAMEVMAYDINEANALAKQAVAKLGSQIASKKLDMQGIQSVSEYINNVVATREKLEEKMYQNKLRAEEKKNMLDYQKMLEIGPALRNISEEYPEGTANQLVGASAKDKDVVTGAWDAINSSEEVADYIASHKGAVGALAKAKNFINVDAIKSLKSDTDELAQDKQRIIDSQIDNAVKDGKLAPDVAQSAKVLNKMLFALALSDVRGSGQRGSIYLDKQFKEIYDQASRVPTLLEIINQRAKDNNSRLDKYKLNIERNIRLDKYPLLRKGWEQYSQDKGLIVQVPQEVVSALKGKPEDSGYKYQGKIYRIINGEIVESED
jgi:hypothetical protein